MTRGDHGLSGSKQVSPTFAASGGYSGEGGPLLLLFIILPSPAMSNLTRLAFSSFSSNKRPGFACFSSYSAAAALCNSRKGPSQPVKQQAPAEASASLPQLAEIPWQRKIANSVRLIGLVGMPVHLEAAPDGNYWAGTVLVLQKPIDSPRVRIPPLFEGDLAQIAACHLKQKDLICVTGQLSGDPPPLPFENSRAKIQMKAPVAATSVLPVRHNDFCRTQSNNS